MSVKRITQLPAFSGVAAGVTATCDIPVGPRYHVIWLRIANAARAVAGLIVGDIRLKVNGKVQRLFTVGQLDDLNKLMGAEYAWRTVAGTPDGVKETYVPIFLAEPWRKQVQAADGLSWSTGDLSTFQLEVDILAGAGVPSIGGFVEVDNSIVKGPEGSAGRQASIGIVSKWNRTNIPVNGTVQDIQTFPRRDHYQQLSFIDPNISKVEVKVEGFVIREITKDDNDAVLISRGMVPVAGRFDLVFDHDDVLDSSLPMVSNGRPVQDFQVRLTLSDGTARNIPCIYQTIGRPD